MIRPSLCPKNRDRCKVNMDAGLKNHCLPFLFFSIPLLTACADKCISCSPPIDTTSPSIVSVTPRAGDSNVPVNSNITVAFSEPINSQTLNTLTFQFLKEDKPVEGSISLNGTTAVFSPAPPLDYLTAYKIKITRGVEDLAGNALANEHVSSFRTVDDPTRWSLDSGGVSQYVSTARSGKVCVAGVKDNGIPNRFDLLAAEFDSSGNRKWTYSVATELQQDEPWEVFATNSYCYVLRAASEWYKSIGGDEFVDQIDSTGTLAKSIFVGSDFGGITRGLAVDGDGNIYVALPQSLKKFSPEGVLLKEIEYPRTMVVRALALDDNSVYVSGDTVGRIGRFDFRTSDLILARYNHDLGEIWMRSRVDSLQEDVVNMSVAPTSGIIYLAGSTGFEFPDRKTMMAGYDTSGNLIFYRVDDDSYGSSAVASDANNGYFIRYERSPVKLNVKGDILWIASPTTVGGGIAVFNTTVFVANERRLKLYDANSGVKLF